MKKKVSDETEDDDLLPEYGPDFFRGLKPNPYAKEPKIYKGRFVVLDPDVSSVFVSSEAVNAVLRDVIHMTEIAGPNRGTLIDRKHEATKQPAAKTAPASRIAKKRRAS
jgi:hypothetical protein